MKIAPLILVAVAAVGQTERSSPGYPAYQKALREFAARNLEVSFGLAEEALRRDPALVAALTLKARIAIAVNRFDIARQALEQAVKTEPRNWYPRFLLGFQFYLQSELQPAAEALGEARRLNPADPKPALYLALTRESTGAIDEALELYREAVKLEEASTAPQAETHLAYARLLLLLGRFEDCARLIDRARRLAPDSRDVAYERARLLLRQGDAAAAAREGERALKLSEGGTAEHQIRYLLVRAWRAAGDEQRAAAHAASLRAAEAAK